jgi:hypothetical protein
MFDFRSYVCEVARTLAPLLHNNKWKENKKSASDLHHIILHLGYLLLLGEEHLEPSMMDEIWKLLPFEERLSLKACMIEACRSSIP